MTVWICAVCGNDGPPCRLDGGEDAGEPIYCPWARVVPTWTEADE